jgi:hypothetical protein
MALQGNYDKYGSKRDSGMEEFINAFDFRESNPNKLRYTHRAFIHAYACS